jgi:hypothetical protein
MQPTQTYITNNGMIITDDNFSHHSSQLGTCFTVNIRLLGGGGGKCNKTTSAGDENIQAPHNDNTTIQPQHLQSNTHNQIASVKYFTDCDDSPITWLNITEANFTRQPNITSWDKYVHIISHMPTTVLSKLSKAISEASKPTTNDPYTILKNAIIGLNQEPNSIIFDRYFKEATLGNQRPSDFLKKSLEDFKNLKVTTDPNDSLFKQFFLKSLPLQAQAILAVSKTTDVIELAALADKIIETIRPTPSLPIYTETTLSQPVATFVAETVQSTSNDPVLCALRQISKDLRDLTLSRSRSPSYLSYDHHRPSRNSSRNFSPSPSRQGFWCPHHQKYRHNAQKCNIGCTWTNKPESCTTTDTCIYHARYRESARSCRIGCRFFKKPSDSFQTHDNNQKNL